MKLQIKTLNHKSLVIDIEETKTVYDLKKELSLYPDVGVEPELQDIKYAGKILVNEEKLSAYNINWKKFLVMMAIKQPLEKLGNGTETIAMEAETTPTAAKTLPTEFEFKSPTVPSDSKEKEKLVSQIVDMGYPEDDARTALDASFYNSELAIQYLLDGIPSSPSTPANSSYVTDDTDVLVSPFTLFRDDPAFERIRSAVQQNPSVIDRALCAVRQTSPIFLDLVTEHQEEFLQLLIEGSDNGDTDNGDTDNADTDDDGDDDAMDEDDD